jgi:septal ring factor EnvC (AmiA/AmiB activator)
LDEKSSSIIPPIEVNQHYHLSNFLAMAIGRKLVSIALIIMSQICPSCGQATSAITSNSSAIDKVVTLITEMKDQCIKDADADTEAYDKYKCWCVTTEEEKKAAIAAAEAKIEELNAFLEEALAKEAELKTEIAGLEEDIAKDQDALETARANREKEHEEFLEEEADMKETLSLLSEAIGVLSKVQLVQKHAGGAKQAALVQVRNIVQRISPKFHSVMQKDLYDMLGSLEDVEEQHLGSVFLPSKNAAALEQTWKRLEHREGSLPWIKTSEEIGKEANPNDLKGMAAGAKSYNSRSGSILGVLKAMGDNVAKDLGAAQKEELQAEIAFQDLQSAKLAEIAAATKNKKEKESELGDLLFKFGRAKHDLEVTEDTLEADQKFLAETVKGCEKEDAEYAKRAKIRAQEITAISETLAILTGDEARSLFDKTISFMQFGVVSHSEVTAAQERAKTSAMQRILAAAKKSKNWALASLAVQVRLDAFTKVKAAMDRMLAELKAEQKAEYEKHEECKKELDVTEDKIKVGQNTKEDLDSKHAELVNLIETLTSEIAALNKEVADMEVSLKQAGEQRKTENEMYQQSVADQRATIRILNMAMARLKKFYTSGTKLVDIHHHAPPPPKSSATNSYEISANSGGIMQLLSTIIADAESVEIELKLTEQNQQKNYAEFAQMTTDTIEADRKAIAEKTEQVSNAEGEKSETEEAQLANDASLAKLNELLVGIHTDCDWLLKYFDLRQKSRAEEMDAIETAKAILSGADFS